MRSCIRGEDLFARPGGEEFVVVLPDNTADSTQRMAERIRGEVEALEFAPHGPSLQVTVSLGVGTSAGPQPFPALMRIADQALYEAKRLGRNRGR